MLEDCLRFIGVFRVDLCMYLNVIFLRKCGVYVYNLLIIYVWWMLLFLRKSDDLIFEFWEFLLK